MTGRAMIWRGPSRLSPGGRPAPTAAGG